MAPLTKAKAAKPAGKDIRMFFGGSSSGSQKQSQPTRPSTQASQRAEVIDISDNDDNKQKKPVQPKPKAKEAAERVANGEINKPVPTPAKPKSTQKSPSSKRTADAMDVDDSDDKPLPKKASNLKRKKPYALISSDEEEDKDKKPAVAVASSSKPKPRTSLPAKNTPKAKRDEDYEMASDEDKVEDDDDYGEDLVPKKGDKKVKASKKTVGVSSKVTDQEKVDEKGKAKEVPKKFNWAAAQAARLAGPVAHGSKDVPDGAPDCLAGLSFVFTGELSSFSRDEAIDLAKRFGGRVVGQPSSKTNFVVLGDNAGPSKLNAIKKHGIATLNEDEFLNLIATRKGSGNGKGVDEKTKKKMEKEKEAIKQAAKEMEKREKNAAKEKAAAGGSSKTIDASSQLWTTRYAPQSLKEICGNKGSVEKLQQWLHDWPLSVKSGFKKPGKHGMNIFRAVLITGSPGIGKTTSAHLVAKLEGFTPIELNASDARSKKLVENGMNINNTSLDGFLGGGHGTNALGVTITDKTCLIMDEVDGMSAGDRGGVGALNAMIKKSKVPIICIANDRGAQKLKPLMGTTYSLPFAKPQAAAVRSRILTIAFKEKMAVPANVIDQLVTSSHSDIRQVLNMLSTWRLSSDSMNFDEGKTLAKMNEKYSMMSPFDITSKMLGPYLFSSTARESLGDKMELYFHDHSFIPLFIHENYLKTQPARIRNLDGPERILKELELMDLAASSISDGDLVDALIHGPEQHWSLMPLHAVCSAIRPASFLYGMGSGYGGPNAMSFPQWLGQNSKQNKLSRALGDVQIRMRLKVSGDKSEIRQSYLPALFPHIVKPLIDVGASAVDQVIDRMDEYYLSKEDWDTVVELGVDQNKDELILKKISTATKSTLTRKYNGNEHPIPFHKAQDLGKLPKKLAGGPAPDLEEAFDLDEVVDDASDDEKKGRNVDDVSNDKLIQAAKKKKTKTTAQTKMAK